MDDKWIDAHTAKYLANAVASDSFTVLSVAASMYRRTYPEFDRDTDAMILDMIQNGAVKSGKLWDSLSFAADSLMCEYAWVIDLDEMTFGGYEGFNTEPLEPGDRFYFLERFGRRKPAADGNVYYGVRLTAAWDLHDLPTDEQFLKVFAEDDDVSSSNSNESADTGEKT